MKNLISNSLAFISKYGWLILTLVVIWAYLDIKQDLKEIGSDLSDVESDVSNINSVVYDIQSTVYDL